MKLRTRIGVGYGVLASILVIAIVVSLLQIERVSAINAKTANQYEPVSRLSLSVRINLHEARLALLNWVVLANPTFKVQRQEAWSAINEGLAALRRLVVELDDERVLPLIRQVERDLTELGHLHQQVETIVHTPENRPDLQILTNQAQPDAELIRERLGFMIEREQLLPDGGSRKQLLGLLAELRGTVDVIMTFARAYLYQGDDETRQDLDALLVKESDRFNTLTKQTKLFTAEQSAAYATYRQARETLIQKLSAALAVRAGPSWNVAQNILTEQMMPVRIRLSSSLNELVDIQQKHVQQGLQAAQDAVQKVVWINLGLLGFGVIAGVSLAWMNTRSVTRPVGRAVAMADAIAGGNLGIVVDIRGFDEVERLGDAMKAMAASLKDLSDRNARQIWHAVGRSALSDVVRGEIEISLLAERAIDCVVRYVGANVGAMYLSTDGGLTRVASVAMSPPDTQTVFAVGEGLIGDAVLRNQLTVVSHVPPGYLTVRSGLGEHVPTSIVICPFSFEGEAIGVYELAKLEPFADFELQFLEEVREILAISFHMARARLRMQDLLMETQSQAEELQAQQEEMLATNEKLEAQAEALRGNEQTLRSQQEQLARANATLKQRSLDLEAQKFAMEEKNIALMQAQAELEHKTEEITQASRYKSEFLSNMSHELRTPLNSLLILAEILKENEHKHLSAEEVQYAKVIHDAGKDLLTLINDILDLAKVEAGKIQIQIEQVPVSDILDVLRRQFEPQAAQKQLALRFEQHADIPQTIDTDSRRVLQILKNLMSNAIKFTATGSVACIVRPAVDEELTLLQGRPGLTFEVRDTGTGIAAEQQHLVFEAFRQADGSVSRKHGGTGLGLAIARQLARLLGGEIILRSEVGVGSQFAFVLSLEANAASMESALPVAIPAAFPNAKEGLPGVLSAASVNAPAATGSRTLLVVEDDINFAETVRTLARRRGFDCEIASDAESALEMLEQGRVIPVGIILDMLLPGINGVEFIERLKQNPLLASIPVHVISAYDYGRAAVQQRSIGFLKKPITRKQLDQIFREFGLVQKIAARLLIAEPESAERQALVDALADIGVQTEVVATGEDAVKHLLAGEYDGLILDLELPDVAGDEVLRRLSQCLPQGLPPTIIHTRETPSAQVSEALHNYTNTIILKEGSQQRIVDEVVLFLRGIDQQLPSGARQAPLTHATRDEILNGCTVLLADDDARNTYALTQLLGAHGINVLTAENGAIALEALHQHPEIDLVLMDIMMPVMDGFEAMRQIRAEPTFVDMPVIALTAKAMKGDAEKCMAAGASDYLMKPVDVPKLLSLLHVWLQRGRSGGNSA